jgi:hypothetical protein
MPRVALETALVAMVAATAAGWWSGFAPVGDAPLLAAGPLVRVLAGTLGVERAVAGVLCAATGLAGGAVWSLARLGGASPPAAALGCAVALASPPVLGAFAAGNLGLVVVAPAALALGLAWSGHRWAAGLAVLACGACDRSAGLAAGCAAWLGGGGVPTLLAALIAAARGADGSTETLELTDLAAPLLTLRAGAVAPGLALLLALAWFVEAPEARRAGFAALVLALGPLLRLAGDVVTIEAGAVPLPGILGEVVAPFSGWTGALPVLAAAVGLGLARLPRVGAAWVLAVVSAVEVLGSGRPAPVDLDPPPAVAALAEGTGRVLDLPVELSLGEPTAPRGTHALYRWYATLHGRPIATPMGRLTASEALFAEPGVVLAVNAALGGERFLLPPGVPGDAASALGITEIALHRRLFVGSLAVLDPVFARMYGPPRRDTAGDVDLYRVTGTGKGQVAPTPLRAAGDPAAAGWRTVADYLRSVGLATPGGVSR